MKKKILIIGTTVLDVLVQKITNKAHVMTGGKGYNIAMNISTLGGDVSFCSSIGTDEYSQKIRTELKSNNIKLVSPHNKEDTTGVYFSLFDGSAEPIFDASRIPKLTSLVLPKDIKKYNIVCLISGVADDIYKNICNTKKENNNLKFCLSLSGRKSVEESLPYIKHIDVLFCNKKEALGLVQKMKKSTKIFSIKYCLDELYKAGIKSVVITDGANGIYFKDKASEGKIKAEKVDKIVSTLGAGDGVVATVLYNHFIQDKALAESCKVASLVSAKIVSQKNSLILKSKKKQR